MSAADPLRIVNTVTGEAREVARVYAALVREIRAYNAPFAAPVVLISEGERTVTLPAGAAPAGRARRLGPVRRHRRLVVTGPTRTNVNDYRAILIL
ncbi:glycerate kinase [Cupriavidus necator]|uniref:Glycerate kinase n=1 Tax=Cupriavidus necator TaxID=106590 RepID=A0A1U9UJ52_CUPNE|nr:glycerate kinase [Cupriavidus necator]